MVSARAECYIVTLPGDRSYSRGLHARHRDPAGQELGRSRTKGTHDMQQASCARQSGGTARPGRSGRHAIATIVMVLCLMAPFAAQGQGSGQGISGQGTAAPNAVPASSAAPSETAQPVGANPAPMAAPSASNPANSPAAAE